MHMYEFLHDRRVSFACSLLISLVNVRQILNDCEILN